MNTKAMFDALGIPDMTELEEDGATICVCSEHLLEHCGKCCFDFTEMNEAARLEAAAMYAAADARDPWAAREFKPRTITVGYDGRKLAELAPGTRLLLRDESGRSPPKDLTATVLKTVWEGDKNNVLDYLDPKTNEPMPCYMLEFDPEDGDAEGNGCGLVVCCDVHDQWEVLAPPPRAAGGAVDEHAGSRGGGGSVATSAVTARTTLHARQRSEQRGVVKRQFQSALKHVARECYLPGLPNRQRPTWLLVHNDTVFCTDEQAKVMITAYPMMKPNDVAVVHHLDSRKDLNGRECRLIRFSDMSGGGAPDGRWEVQFLGTGGNIPSGLFRVKLCNLKPAGSSQAARGDVWRSRQISLSMPSVRRPKQEK